MVLRDARGCDGLAGLVEEQVRVCRRQVEAMEAVQRGTELAVLECQHQFHSRCWNCSTLQGLQVFSKATIQGTWESAFIHAISAAGIAFAVTCACSLRELHKCGYTSILHRSLGDPLRGPGCSDNLSYRIAFSQAFVDSPERSCGVSSIMPPFRQVGNVLKEKFEGAAEVYPKRVGSRKLLVPKSSRFKPYTAHVLVYLLASPEFCDRDPRRTWLATDGCELRCCGRGFPTARAELVQRCSCEFRRCCSEQGEQSRLLVEVHGCR
uniref:Protein Wnt n=1 Tax=Corvus moneduloides TaxID=1196302 RepID=A0A8C3GX23_CORMO